MITVNELKSLIPHGKRKEIAAKAGVSGPAVTKFLNGQTRSSLKIHQAALEVALAAKNSIHTLETELKKKRS